MTFDLLRESYKKMKEVKYFKLCLVRYNHLKDYVYVLIYESSAIAGHFTSVISK